MYNRRNRLVRGFFVWFAVMIILIVAVLVIEQIGKPSGPPEPKVLPPTYPASPSQPSRAAPGAPPAPASQEPSLSGPLQVVQGKQEINGVQLGFPHSTAGAVSAADAFMTEIGSTLDPDRASAVMRLVADPSAAGGPQQAAQGAINDRKDLGLPATGPVPSGTSLAIEPVEYQVRDITPDKVEVLLLCDSVTTQPSRGTQTSYGVFPVQTHWNAGDWRIMPAPGGSEANLAAEPDSPQAAALGWQDLQPPQG